MESFSRTRRNENSRYKKSYSGASSETLLPCLGNLGTLAPRFRSEMHEFQPRFGSLPRRKVNLSALCSSRKTTIIAAYEKTHAARKNVSRPRLMKSGVIQPDLAWWSRPSFSHITRQTSSAGII